jgi:small subunit ribosomal protein S16
MKRGGRTHAPYYRVVVMDSRDRTTGRVIEELGIYHPCARPEPKTEINAQRALEWLKLGAQPSNTARSVLSKKGVMAAYASGQDLPAEEAPAEAPAEPEATPES